MNLNRTLRWRALEHEGLEHLHVVQTPAGVSVSSAVIGAFEGSEFGATYDMTLAPDWSFRSLVLERMDDARLVVFADGKGNWSDGENKPIPKLAGCIDIDISATPFTNTLPIRRLKLAAGAPQHLRIAWVPMDSLDPFVDEQIYSRIDAAHYHYAAADGSFDADIVVDADGFVVDYPPLFARI